MQKNIQRLKSEKLHETIVQKQKKSFALSFALLLVWTILVSAAIIYSYFNTNSSIIKLGINGAEIVANRYVLSQEVNFIFKDIYFDLPNANIEPQELSEADLENLLGSSSSALSKMNNTRLSPVINELYGNNGVYVNFVGSQISKDETKPDLWTITGLEALAKGEPYVYEMAELYGAPYLRVLLPARVSQKHKDIKAQNYVHRFFRVNPVGTLYSGVSVYYPLSTITNYEETRFYTRILALAALWLFGTIGIIVYGGRFLDLIAKYSELKAKVTTINYDAQKEIDNCLHALKVAAADKEEALKNKAQFFTKVSHEIRTPLNGVLGMSELLLRTKLNDEQSYQVASLRASANNLLDVFNDIWDYSRMEMGTLQVDSQPFALRELLYSVVKIYMHQANSKGIELIANIAPNIPDNLLGDPTRIRQVLSNLLSNAIKFTDKGEILLSVSETSIVDDIAKVNFIVKDTGIGISPDKRATILSAEQMHDSSSKRKFEGLGLGLAISSRLIALMGGKLQLESAVGTGSTFSFSLNLPYLPGVINQKQDSALVLKNEHVLIVDDNATNRRILREQVKSWGMIPSDCTGVDEALRLLQVSSNSYTPFSVVISDLQMPEKDGIDLVQEMKKDSSLAQIPVVLLSSAILSTDLVRELFFASLYKPAKPTDLIKALVAAVNHKAHLDRNSLPEVIQDEKHITSEHNFHILLVEDLEINKLVVSSILKELGHEVSVAKDGQEAVDMIAKEEYDLVLMDIHMPVMDGIQAAKIIRERESENGNTRHLPIIALTANAENDIRSSLISIGLDSYILKPTALQDLHYEIERVAERFNLKSRAVKVANAEKSKDTIRVIEQAPLVYSPSIVKNTEENITNPSFTAKPSIASKIADAAEEAKAEPKKDKPYIADIKSVVDERKFEPSIFSESKKLPLVKSESTSEPSIAKHLPPINAGVATQVINLSAVKKEEFTPKLDLDTSKFAPSISVDKEKMIPTLDESLVEIAAKQILNEKLESKAKETEIFAENNKQIIEDTNDLAIQNELTEKDSEDMEMNGQDVSTHFSGGKERKVVLPLDITLLTKSFASYPDLAYRSIEIFLRDAPKSLLEIKNAIEVDDNSTLTVSAHAVKGLISYYSKGLAYDLALKLEQMGRDKALPEQKADLLTTLSEFEKVFDSLIDAMKVYME